MTVCFTDDLHHVTLSYPTNTLSTSKANTYSMPH